MSDGESQPLIRRTHRSPSFDVPSAGRHWRNLFVLSITFLLCFIAFGAIQNIQSSVNTSDALGLISPATVYGSLMLSCLLAPAVINQLGTKWTIVFAVLGFCPYLYASFFPGYVTLIPSSFVLGFSAARLWVAQGTYLTTSAIQLATLVNEAPEFVINRFNGYLFAFFQLGQIFGNLLSATVLDAGMNDEKSTNVSSCGVHSCSAVILSSAPTPSAETVQLLIMKCCIIGSSAVLLSMCLDQQPSAASRTEFTFGSLLSSVVATVRLTGNWKLYLLIPVFMYSGMEQAFIVTDFTTAYVTCTLGVSHVGVVMAIFCSLDAFASLLVGFIEKRTGRVFLFFLGFLVQFSLMVVMYLWTPIGHTEDSWQLYLMAAGWGIGDAVFQTQCASIVGKNFASCQEPAFSNYRFWQSAGFCISFALSIPSVVCISHKLIGIGSWLIFSLVMYFICEYKIRRESNALRQDDS